MVFNWEIAILPGVIPWDGGRRMEDLIRALFEATVLSSRPRESWLGQLAKTHPPTRPTRLLEYRIDCVLTSPTAKG